MKSKPANICDNCINWEDPAESKLAGMKRTPNHGYCVLFQKETTRNYGLQCTAFESWPSDQEQINDLARSESDINQPHPASDRD